MSPVVKILLFSLILFGCSEQNSSKDKFKQTTPLTDSQATYVGAKQCASCHQQQTKEWQQSDHFHARQSASTKTVLGDFSKNQAEKNSQYFLSQYC